MSADIFSTPIITVDTVHVDDVVVVGVAGELDMASAEELELAIRRELLARPKGLVIDLLGVRFCGSAGLHVLILARQETQSVRTRLRLVVAGAEVVRPLEISGLAQLFRIHRSVSEALASLAA
jgi:anti-sigma B factor antagonist